MERGGKEQKESIIDTDVEPVDMIPDKRKKQKKIRKKREKERNGKEGRHR